MSRVAIIEDDRDFCQILRECLEEEPEMEVIATFGCEDDATAWMRSGGLQQVDCMLCDLMLPKSSGQMEVSSMCGLRLVQEMRQTHRFAGTILILTNSREFADGQRALAAGCDGYLCKHAPMSEIPHMLAELRLALRGEIVAVSREMRHVFLREELSVKESRLMDMLHAGHSWAEIARELGYKTAKAAANIGYRVFDKLLTEADKQGLGADGDRKRTKALERWRARLGYNPSATPGTGAGQGAAAGH
jgi:DNA-binding NarL/FixJ family response regulator